MMLKATDSFPMNFGFSGKGNASDPGGLLEVIEAGAFAASRVFLSRAKTSLA